MKKLLSLGVVILLAGMAATAIVRQPGSRRKSGSQRSVRGSVAGCSLEAPGPDGKIHRANCIGMFCFTGDAHASVQVMERNPPPPAATGSEQYSRGGYEATFGTYEADESAHTFTFHVEGALVRSLIRQRLVALFPVLRQSTHREVHSPGRTWKVTWEHY